MKRFLLSIALLCLAAIGLAQSPYTLIVQSFDAKHFDVVYPVHVGQITNFHVGNLKLGSPDIDFLPGAAVGTKTTLALSGGILWSVKLGDNLTGVIGPSIRWQSNDRPYPGILVGFSIKL